MATNPDKGKVMASVSRRSILGSAALAAPLVLGGRLFAAPAAASGKTLVVFLRGAYDALNVIVPTASDFYHSARPTIALSRPEAGNPASPLPLDADWSLHPALKDSIKPMWDAGEVAFVPFAGTEDMSRSHFETQNSIELGQSMTGTRDYQSGFMGRLAGVLAGAAKETRPIAFSEQLPLCFRGGPDVPNIALGNGAAMKEPVFNDTQQALIESMYRDRKIGAIDIGSAVREGLAVKRDIFVSLQEEMEKAGQGAISSLGFAGVAQRIGQLMRESYDLAFVDVSGWDTHVNQGSVEGVLARRIEALGHGLAAFAKAIGPQAWRSTSVVVLSEFGRTFHENGNKGTDHGHGSIYWVLGGAVRGKRMAGPQVRLAPETLNQQRDLPVLTDYRALLGEVFARQFGLTQAQLGKVFPGVTPADLRVL